MVAAILVAHAAGILDAVDIRQLDVEQDEVLIDLAQYKRRYLYSIRV